MISLDQVYLLEQKVESAVAKIQQLQAENDALRNKCTELTNALSAKSEQLSSFESDQSQIETGIKKALDRLNSIENSVLKTATQINQAAQAAKAAAPVKEEPAPQEEESAPSEEASTEEEPASIQTPSFNTMDTIPQVNEETEESFEGEEEIDTEEDDNHDGLGFDIF